MLTLKDWIIIYRPINLTNHSVENIRNNFSVLFACFCLFLVDLWLVFFQFVALYFGFVKKFEKKNKFEFIILDICQKH